MDKKQAQMKQQITMMLSKKEYYDILGIQKSATQTQIKKSYKKLALRFHPDKNNMQGNIIFNKNMRIGSKQVFKKVSNAYSTLINPQKKQHYDKYGLQQQRQAQQQQHRRQYYYQNNNQDQQFDEFDQIFRAFFGGMGGVRMQNRHYYQQQQQRQYYQQDNPNAARQQQQGFGLGFIFLIFFIIYTISPLFKSPPYFSLQLSSVYRFKTATQVLSTSYYVREQFLTQSKTNLQLKQSIDLQVDELYLNNLRKTCEKATTYKKRLEYQAYQYNPGAYRDYYLSQAEKVDVTSCRRFNKLNQKQPEYVARFFRYK